VTPVVCRCRNLGPTNFDTSIERISLFKKDTANSLPVKFLRDEKKNTAQMNSSL
jgi:hypothetical protein